MSARLGLALGGGAARGLAHVGVLEVLLDAGLRPAAIAATSFGALAGAAVASRGLDARAARGVAAGVEAHVRSDAFRRSKLALFRRTKDMPGRAMTIRDVVRRGVRPSLDFPDATLLPAGEVAASIDALVPDAAIESLPCAFGSVAVDVATGEELLLDRGSLRLAVHASCAIPGLMEPVPVAGRMALDGGWADKVPAGPARELGAECVVAVDVSDELADTKDMQSGLNMVHRGDALRSHRLKSIQLREADVVIACDLVRFGWADFELAADIVEAGRVAARAALPRVVAALETSGTLRSRGLRALERCARRMRGASSMDVVRCVAT